MNSPQVFQRVYSRPNEKPPSFLVKKLSTLKKQPFWKKTLRLKSKLGTTFFRGLVCPTYSAFGSQRPRVMILDHLYTIHQMYGPQIFVFSEKFEGHTLYDKTVRRMEFSHYLVAWHP